MFNRFPRFLISCACLLQFFNFSLASADEIFLRNPKLDSTAKPPRELKSVRGTIKDEDMNVNEVVITASQTKVEIVETANIETIRFDHAPREFDIIHDRIARRDFAGAAAELEEMLKKNPEPTLASDLIQQEFEFLKVYIRAMSVVTGSSAEPAGTVAGALVVFFQKHPKHYRYFEGMEAVGHLSLLAGGDKKLTNANTFYGKLDASTLKEYKIRRNLFYTRALLSEGKFDEAASNVAAAVAEKSDVKTMSSFVQQAKVAQAVAEAGKGQIDPAVKRLEQIIDETPASDRESHARANLALGNIYLAKNLKIEALLAFLKIDLLAPSYPDVQAETLAKLSKLWNEIPNRNTESANNAKSRLNTLYPHSKWNKS